MDNSELLEKIYERFDKLNDKLDTETAARNEQQVNTTKQITDLDKRLHTVEHRQAGQIKLFYLLITSMIGGIITWITSQFK